MNTLSILLIVSTTFSLITSLIGPLTALVKAVTTIPQRIKLLKDEVRTVGEILGECLTTIEEAPTKALPHVQDLGITTYEQWKDVGELAERAWDATAPNSKSAFMSAFWRIRAARYINKREGELVSAVANLRDKVGLLRDACSEIRVRSQLVEISATMTRLGYLSASSKASSGIASHNHTYQDTSYSADTISEKQNQQQQQVQGVVQNIFQRDVASWHADEYILNGVVQVDQHNTATSSQGMVALEDSSRTGGKRFTLSPARIKVDTSPAANFVSLEYLNRIGFDLQSLDEIPADEQRQVEGLDKVLYTPRRVVTLQWYKQGELHMNTTAFFVVAASEIGAPAFEILLSARGFAEEAEPRLFSSSLMRRRKTLEQLEADYQAAKKRRDARRTDVGAVTRRKQQAGSRQSIMLDTQNHGPGRDGGYRSAPQRTRERDLEMGGIRDTSWSSESGQRPLNHAQPSRAL